MEGDHRSPLASGFNRYRLLLRYAMPARGLLAAIAVLTLCVSCLAILEPWPMKVLVDNVLSVKPLTGAAATISMFLPGAGTRTGLLAWVALAGLTLFALGSALDVVLTEAWVRAGQRTTYGLAAAVFGKLQRRSLAFHGDTSVGDSMTRVMSDSWCVNSLVDSLLFKPALALITGTGVLVIMARMDSQLTLLSLLVLPPMVAASMMTGPRIRKASKARRAAQVQVNSHLQQSLSGVAVIKAFGQEETESARFGELADASIRSEQRASVTMQLNTLASGMVSTVGVGGVLWVGAHDVMAGRLTLGGLLLFVTYLKTLQGRLRALAGIYSTLQSVDASVNRVISALSEPEVSERPGAPSIGTSRGHVRLERVTFGYDADRPVIRDVSLEARAGETVAIVGATGAGKSTLVALVSRLMDPWNGRVLLDGKDVRELRIDDVRRQIAWVPQETFLVPGSIAENIAYGRPGATRQDIENAAVAATAHEFIRRLPQGFDTRLGERGMTLSGGERQRLAIARAMILDTPILILDEPTSALDAETEEQLQIALRRLGNDRTVIVIAHRLATIRRATRVVVLDRGRVVEEGSHLDLLRKNGAYARMSARGLGEPAMHASGTGYSGMPT